MTEGFDNFDMKDYTNATYAELVKKETNADVSTDCNNGITFKTSTKWYRRVYNLLTNPFRYIFNGKLQY